MALTTAWPAFLALFCFYHIQSQPPPLPSPSLARPWKTKPNKRKTRELWSLPNVRFHVLDLKLMSALKYGFYESSQLWAELPHTPHPNFMHGSPGQSLVLNSESFHLGCFDCDGVKVEHSSVKLGSEFWILHWSMHRTQSVIAAAVSQAPSPGTSRESS